TSYLFREFKDYAPIINSYYLNGNTSDIIKILSIGCSTGQEVYSLAIYCLEHNIPCEIMGIDLSESAIQKAKKAEYSLSYELQKNLENLGSEWNNHYKKYFTITGDSLSPNTNVKQRVRFRVEDSSKLNYFSEFDFIIARKMLYYLPEKNLRDTIDSIKKALKSGLDYSQHILIDDFTYHKIPALKQMIYHVM
ncbi:unnamed protein product, partial [marine sediment metagenome]